MDVGEESRGEKVLSAMAEERMIEWETPLERKFLPKLASWNNRPQKFLHTLLTCLVLGVPYSNVNSARLLSHW